MKAELHAKDGGDPKSPWRSLKCETVIIAPNLSLGPPASRGSLSSRAIAMP
jgi:hypothetical protein